MEIVTRKGTINTYIQYFFYKFVRDKNFSDKNCMAPKVAIKREESDNYCSLIDGTIVFIRKLVSDTKGTFIIGHINISHLPIFTLNIASRLNWAFI